MQIRKVSEPGFRRYGRILPGLALDGLPVAMAHTLLPEDVVYVASDAALESLPLFDALQDEVFGGMPVQLGYCNGSNHLLNAVEYHRTSEIDIAATDLILILGAQQDIVPDTFRYDTGRMEAFLVPAGTAVELYATTLHYAPANAGGPFRCAVALPRGTNEPLAQKPGGSGENALLFARNKWLIAHPESGLNAQGAFVGLTGANLSV